MNFIKISRSSFLPLIIFSILSLFLLLASTSDALTFHINNQSNENSGDVYVTVAGNSGSYDVPGMTNDVPKKLSGIPNEEITINTLVSGRIYISYNNGVTSSVPFDSKTRFDWAELTVTPSSTDVANLTAVDQFGIGMRLTTKNGNQELESIGTANASTIFKALQEIPGGLKSTVRNTEGEIIRVLSPLHSDAYPLLTDYVQSMEGTTVVLNTAFFGTPFVLSQYFGTFDEDGKVHLEGTSSPSNQAPEQFTITGDTLIDSIYTGVGTPNTLEGTLTRDLLAGFNTGLWDSKYGNNSLNFCDDAISEIEGSWCPNGFNEPNFGDARIGLESYATCNQYAATINKYSDSYGSPYSDASKKVTVGLDQPGTGGDVTDLELTILPDSGTASPNISGSSNCGAKPVVVKKTKVKTYLYKKVKLSKGSSKVLVGNIYCSKSCNKVKVVSKLGKRVFASTKLSTNSKKTKLRVRLTLFAKKKIKKSKRVYKYKLKTFVYITPKPTGSVTTKKQIKQTVYIKR